jgi:murein peptide amidase A
MKRKGRSSTHSWVYAIWGVNLAVLVCLLGAVIFYLNSQGASAANDPAGTPNGAPTQKLPPTVYYLPTLTPNPFSTLPVFETSTPFILDHGQQSNIIGLSHEGRPIDVYTFGEGGREYLIVAGIHGGSEWNTIALANELIRYVNDHPEIIPTDVRLHIIRNMNPDGEARAHGVDGRVNNRGVDLNRNFPSRNWSAEWDRDGCWVWRPTTGGTHGGSEPETRTVMSFISSRNLQAVISYHSAALGVFPGGDPWEPDSIRLARLLARETGYPYPPLDTGCEYTGTLADWAVENGVGAAVDMELRNHTSTDFDENLEALKIFLDFLP